MFERIFTEYSLLAVAVIAGISIIFNHYFGTLNDLGTTITNFINSYNN